MSHCHTIVVENALTVVLLLIVVRMYSVWSDELWQAASDVYTQCAAHMSSAQS